MESKAPKGSLYYARLNGAAMKKFLKSYNQAARYPENIIYHNTYEHSLRAYFRNLNDRNDSLFIQKGQAAVDFWEYDHRGYRFQPTCATSANDIENLLQVTNIPRRGDPWCRFVFFHAPNSREALSVTRTMMVLVLSYYQVMPTFLDFLFPFGHQGTPRDFYFSGFRLENRSKKMDRGLRIDELGRSGLDLRLCYGLKSVEQSTRQRKWPWSIRQMAIYHSFDLETSRASWIVVKGSKMMKDRITSETKNHTRSELASFETISGAFASTLATHLVFCEWSGENWRWYINFLEEQLQEVTQKPLSAPVEFKSPMKDSPCRGINRFDPPIPTNEGGFLLGNLSHQGTKQADGVVTKSPDLSFPVYPGPQDPPELPSEETARKDMSFNDLQRVHFITGKINEALLVLKANSHVVTELKQHYRSIIDSEDCPEKIKQGCDSDVTRFESRLLTMEDDTRMQQWRLETLLRLVADRKALLYSILQYQSTQANNAVAKRSQRTADNMEDMTRDMHAMTQKMNDIARKTKQETIAMKIITLVTLFFLPGTFISTLMSTDIVRFPTDSTGVSTKTVSLGALRLYLAISIPLTFVTFICSFVLYWWVRRERKTTYSSPA